MEFRVKSPLEEALNESRETVYSDEKNGKATDGKTVGQLWDVYLSDMARGETTSDAAENQNTKWKENQSESDKNYGRESQDNLSRN